ncbi:MAG: ChaN family lipoprotein [Candidatus Micrarchaeota archaeon]
MFVFEIYGDASKTTAKQPQIIDENLPPGKFIVDVEQKKIPINYSAIVGDAKFFYVGEKHRVGPQRDEMKNILKATKTAVLALECLPSSDQKYIDEFLKGKNEGGLIIGYLKKRMGDEAESYMNLIKFARDKHLSVIALEAPSRGDLKKFKGSTNLRGDYDSRNKHWVQVLADYQKANPEAKIAVFVGASHILSLNKLFPSGCRPLDISETNEEKVKHKFAPLELPSETIWGHLTVHQKLRIYQESTGETDFAVRTNDRTIIVKGKIE